MFKLRCRHGWTSVPCRITCVGRGRLLRAIRCRIPTDARPWAAVVCGVLVLVLSGCRGQRGSALTGHASDEWTRSYALSRDGELQIVGGNGSVDIQGGTGTSVEVRAERVARASTDAAAREILPRIAIREDVSPDKIVLQTEGLSGIVIGVDVAVNYHVMMPSSARARVRAVNGDVTVADLDGQVVLSSTNGEVIGRNLRGGVDARSVNKGVTVSLGAFGRDPVDLRATNGSVDLTIPADVNATLEANHVNGSFDIKDLVFEPLGDQTLRRARGRLNAGGSPITITTVNGNIRVHPKAQP
jgi:putative adhesin